MSLSLADKVIQSRAGGAVERCHVIRHHGSYSVASHSWGVAMLMHYLWPEDFPRLALHCLSHDVAEAWIGDIPAPALRYSPGLRESVAEIEESLNQRHGLPSESELNKDDFAKLKACDRLDFWIWCREQVAAGNKFALEGLQEIERYLNESPLPLQAHQLYNSLRERGVLPLQQGVIREIANEQGK